MTRQMAGIRNPPGSRAECYEADQTSGRQAAAPPNDRDRRLPQPAEPWELKESSVWSAPGLQDMIHSEV
jgi:hypothetical protein